MVKLALAAAAIVLLGLGIAYLVSPLHTFNTLVPKDGDSREAAADIAFGSHERQRLDVYEPRNMGPGPHPVIVWFYGGSWDSGTRHGYDFVGRALAAQGFVTVIPDYRLVPEVRFPGFVEDGAEAVRWVQENIGDYGGDASRIVLGGHSAGAYIAAMLANDPRWLDESRSALRGMVGLAGPYDFTPLDVPSTIAAFGQWPDVMDTQPVRFVSGDAPPALLLTGADDTTVKPRNSQALSDRLAEAGVEADMVSYPGVDHIDIVIALSRPLRGRTPVLDDVTAFARRVTANE